MTEGPAGMRARDSPPEMHLTCEMTIFTGARVDLLARVRDGVARTTTRIRKSVKLHGHVCLTRCRTRK